MSSLRQSSTREGPLDVDAARERALEALLAHQRADGHWVFELEADATVSAEYVLLVHYLGETPDQLRDARSGRYLRRRQNPDGGWPLFTHGQADVSASVKAYFALKMLGDDPEAEHMRRARASILAQGGANQCNVSTRTLLALYGGMPWRAVPVVPVEIMLLPRWFPFHLSKVSYWSRTVLVPLLVLNSLRPRARNPRGIRIDELLVRPGRPPCLSRKAPYQQRLWFGLFSGIDAMLRGSGSWFAQRVRQRAIERAEDFVRERVNGEHGLGAIFPAMVNAVMMFDALGVAHSDPVMAGARRAIDRLLVAREHEAYCQPCLAPVRDTALACHALLEVGGPRASRAAVRGLAWLRPLQVLDQYGDWAMRRPRLRPGGWAFQYENAHYPDVDATAVVVMALNRAAQSLERKELEQAGALPKGEAIARAVEWVAGMQSDNGGWGTFEPENIHFHLNNFPLGDQGYLLDPPTVDVTARCLSMLAQLEHGASGPAAFAALRYLLAEQQANGSWPGRRGTQYIHGTWSVLCALQAAGVPPTEPEVQRAASWLLGIQNNDGGWGEAGDSCPRGYGGHEPAPSTASQTAWALMGLMAAGASGTAAVARGIAYLVRTQQPDGNWLENFTTVGFPGVSQLRHHGYSRYFPLWALARYRNLQLDAACAARWGM